METERFIEDVLQVFHRFQGFIGRLPAAQLVDFGLQLLEDVGSSGEDVESVTEEAGRGISSREKDVQTLVSQLFWVSGLFG
jgi:hypothetical protein